MSYLADFKIPKSYLVPDTFAYCSANVAFIRLKDVISADRAAVPCGRWVPHVPGVFHLGKTGCLPFKVKPRWRWVSR